MTDCMLYFDPGLEATISATSPPASTYVFPVEKGQDPTTLVKALQHIHGGCCCEVLDERAVSVVLPPSISVGSDPVDLKRVAFVLAAQKAVEDLGLEGQLEACCGNDKGCCVN